jgi:hypothetical protein
MPENDDVYRVKIEPAVSGGYACIVTKENPYYANVKIHDTVEECKAWAAQHVAWLRQTAPVAEYEL